MRAEGQGESIGPAGRRGVATATAPTFERDCYLTDGRELFCVADVLDDGSVLLENARTAKVTLHAGEDLTRANLRLVEPRLDAVLTTSPAL